MQNTQVRLYLILPRWLFMVMQGMYKRPPWPQDTQRLKRRNLRNNKNNKKCSNLAAKATRLANTKYRQTIRYKRNQTRPAVKPILNNKSRKLTNNNRKETPDKRLFRKDIGLANQCH